MMKNYRRTYAEINLDHLVHNVQLLRRSLDSQAFFCPMVKADAYGHGDIAVTRALQKAGVDHVGVCLLEEGVRLREAGISCGILVFGGFDAAGAEVMVTHRLTPVVSQWEQLEHLEKASVGLAVDFHLKFDTGMNRLGFRTEEASHLFERLKNNHKIRVRALAMHLYEGEDAIRTDGKSAVQLRRFNDAFQVFQPLGVFAHALNSAGSLSKGFLKTQNHQDSQHPLFLQDWGARPGLMIYGYNPVDDKTPFKLKPVMSWKAQVNTIRSLHSKETVSYGGTWAAAKESIVAVISAGYADGYHRILSNQSVALFNGVRVPVVGTVCMDYLMIDITAVVGGQDNKKLQEAEVVLMGESSLSGEIISAAELAPLAKSNAWEMLTSVSKRVPRIYKGAGL